MWGESTLLLGTVDNKLLTMDGSGFHLAPTPPTRFQPTGLSIRHGAVVGLGWPGDAQNDTDARGLEQWRSHVRRR